MNRTAAGILCGALCLVFASRVSARRYALLVGNNAGGEGVDSLRYAQSDARRFQDVLIHLAGFDPQDIQLLADCDSAGLDKALGAMRKRLGGEVPGQEDMFLFYYSGHSDRDALRLGNTRYSLEHLRDAFQAVPSQVKIGIFDACQSGMLTRFKGGSASKPISLESLKNVYGQVIIASSAMDERSQESDLLEGSVFTHHWLNGLRGSADISGDRKVTLNEAYNYAYRMTVETTSRTRAGIQHPAYQFRIHGEGDIVLADLTEGHSGLVFGFRQDGKYLVVDKERGDIVADFYKGPDRETEISLPPGDYNVLKVERDLWRIADVTVPSGRLAEFNPNTLRKQSQVINQIKGSLTDKYQVIPGPPSYQAPLGPDRKWGASLKFGEGTNMFGVALLYNLDPDLQVQGGFAYPLPKYSLDNFLNPDNVENSAFLMLRKYEGPYFFDTGLNVSAITVTARDSLGSASNTGWTVGVPVHFGMEIGPRQSVFGTVSIGYVLMLRGGGDYITARSKTGSFASALTDESGLSFGVALGMYLF